MARKSTKSLVEENEVLESQEVEASIEETVEEVVEEDQVEESAASETLKANSKPAADSMSKVEMMKSVIGAMGAMGTSDLVNFFNQVQSQYGKGKDWGVGNNSAKNAASVATKGAMKEDMDVIFSGEDLSEDFKEKATTLFEAAVSAASITETARLEEEFETKLVEEVETIRSELVENLDKYLDHVVEKWMEDNVVAVESALRNEIMEEFIDGLKGLFSQHYVDIPNEKLDVLESLADKVEELENALNEAIAEKSELKKSVVENERKDIFANVSEGLTMTEAEKFAALAEGIEFDGDLTKYEKKLTLVKENYFSKKVVSSTINEEIAVDDVDQKEEISYSDPSMKRYAEVISRNVKK